MLKSCLGGISLLKALADQAFILLEERFIKGFYMPNEKLSENQLCKEFKMSRTPLRQALNKFIENGYITSVDKKGIFVKPISIKYCIDCRDLLIILEKAMIDILENNQTNFDFECLQQIIDKQTTARDTNNYYNYLCSHFDFRMKLFEYANNTALSRAYKQLVKDLIRIIMIVWRKTENKSHYSTISKNQELLDLLKQGNFNELKSTCCKAYVFELDESKLTMYISHLLSPDFVD